MPANPYLRSPTPRSPLRPLVSKGLAISGAMIELDAQPPTAKGGGIVSGTNTGDVTLAGESYITISGQAVTVGKPTEAQLTTADNTTLDVSTSKHGFAPKAPNDAAKQLNGLGLYSTARLKSYTVATLPVGTQGDIAFVTDALAPTFLAAVVGGGSVVTPVFFNGSSWIGF